MLSEYVVDGETGAGVPLAHEPVAVKPFGIKHGMADSAVADIWCAAAAFDIRSVATHNADIVQEARLPYEIGIYVKLSNPGAFKSLLSHKLAVDCQNLP